MKIARFFAYIFACIGVVLLFGSMGFLLLNRNAAVRIREIPQGAVSCCEGFAQALNQGDLTGAAQYVYGQPDLGASGMPTDPETKAVWTAFLNSISFAYTSDCQVMDSGLCQTASITTLDVAGVLEQLPERTQALVNQKITSAQDILDVYDESGRFREELAEQILREALQQCLAQEGSNITRDVTVKIINRDGSWWIVPDQALFQALSGLA